MFACRDLICRGRGALRWQKQVVVHLKRVSEPCAAGWRRRESVRILASCRPPATPSASMRHNLGGTGADGARTEAPKEVLAVPS